MISSNPRRRRSLAPLLQRLESLRLLSLSIASITQTGDFVGPDASQGSDGIVDLQLSLAGLSTTAPIDHITVTSYGVQNVQSDPGVTPPLQWATAPDPNGYAFTEYFETSPTSPTANLYINPEIRVLASSPAGTGSPTSLGGSTGPLGQLQNNDWLTVTVYYQNSTSASTSYQLTTLISATDPVTPPATPRPVVGTFGVQVATQNGGQDGQGPAGWENGGLVHITVTAPSGVTFNSNEFNAGVTQNGLLFQMSDTAGLEWDSTAGSHIGNDLYSSMVSSTSVNIFFPPRRNEAPVNGSTASTMTLQVTLPGSSTVYATSFMGQNWNLALLASAPNTQLSVSNVSSASLLQTYLNEGYGTIGLASGQLITSNAPIQITNSVTINGNGATLEFQQSGAAWPSTATGAIYVLGNNYQNLQIALNSFTIDFANAPIQWANPTGEGYATANFDPLYVSAPGGEPTLAVINDKTGNQNYNMDYLSLNQMSISGPPAFDSGSPTENYSTVESEANAQNVSYAGEKSIDLILTNKYDSGNITGPGTFVGGSVDLIGGPWSVTGNTVQGALAGTYSPSAFTFTSAHDVLLQGNSVTQAASTGMEIRLVNVATNGVNDVVENNSFGGGGRLTELFRRLLQRAEWHVYKPE